MSKPRVLILCTGNSCRSQMGEGWVRHDLGDRVEVHSAGTKPSFVHPRAIQVMAEAGVDLSRRRRERCPHVSPLQPERLQLLPEVLP